MTYEERIDKIEKYLNGELDDKELETFEEQLKSDNILAKDLETHKRLHEALSDDEKNALADNLDSISKSYAVQRQTGTPVVRYLMLAAAIGTILFSSWYFVLRNPASDPDGEQIILTEEDTKPEQNPDIPTINEDNNDPGQIAQLEDTPDKYERPPEFINQENIFFENLIAENNSRPFDFDFDEGKNAFDSSTDEGVFGFTGSVATLEDLSVEDIEIQYYKNTASDLSNDHIVASEAFSLEEDEDIKGFGGKTIYQFDFRSTASLDKGMYYFIVRDKKSGKNLGVGKLRVE